jgi:hypothetical protein
MRRLLVFLTASLALAVALAASPRVVLAGVFGEDDDGFRCGDDMCARSERCCVAVVQGGACAPQCTRGQCPPPPCSIDDP